jgi:hypothetical protein
MDLHAHAAAEEQLIGTISAAAESGNLELEAQARAALGIYYAHHGRGGDALAHLERSIRLMPLPCPDKTAATRYLAALREGDGAALPGPTGQTARLIREFVLARLPEGLVSRLGVRVSEDGGVKWDVEVSRPLSDTEARQLHDLIDLALETFQPENRI